VALFRPDIGLISYVGYSLFGPHSFAWYLAKSFPHVQAIAVCTLVGYVLSLERKQFPIYRETVLLALLWALFGISTLVAMFPQKAFDPFTTVSKIMLMVFLSLSIINSEKRIHLVLRVIALAIGLHAIRGALFVVRTAGDAIVYGPVQTILEANNSIGLAMVMNLPFLYYLAQIETNNWCRRIMQVMMFATYPAVVATFSRGAWSGLAVVTIIFMLKSKNKWLGTAMLILSLIGAPIVIPMLVSDRMIERYDTLENVDEDSTAQQRIWSWEFCKRVGMDRPMFGAGFHFYSQEAYARYYPEFLERYPGKVWSCHSSWLSIFAEHGAFALLIWIALLWSCFVSLGQIRRSASRTEHAEKYVVWAGMLQTSLIAFSVVGTFVDFAYYETYYHVIAIVVLLRDNLGRLGSQQSVTMAKVGTHQR
jgi:probable O-glycosylation ligase (exosortase A-associated)